jgi:Uma2 family endonuclease
MTITCGPGQGENLVTLDPTVVFEVVSAMTQAFDRTIKLADYNATSSIKHYVLLEQCEPLVDVYSRGPNDDFNLRSHETRGWMGWSNCRRLNSLWQ